MFLNCQHLVLVLVNPLRKNRPRSNFQIRVVNQFLKTDVSLTHLSESYQKNEALGGLKNVWNDLHSEIHEKKNNRII